MALATLQNSEDFWCELTLDSTGSYLKEWSRKLTARGLTKVQSRFAIRSELRSMHVTPDIADILSGGTNLPFPSIRVDGQNTIFLAGQFTTVSLQGDPGKRRPDLERLRGLDEAWACCYRSPRPGWRLLGRWVDVDVFVGIRLLDRHALGTERKYELKAQQMIDDWQRAFPDLPVVRGTALSEYITGSVRNVDQYDF